jgi:hypothetical protein
VPCLLYPQSFTRLGKDHVGRSDNSAAAAAAAAADAGGGEAKGSSIADMLAAEVAELKDKRKDRFKRREGGVRGTLFVEFPAADGKKRMRKTCYFKGRMGCAALAPCHGVFGFCED